jgi:hypothetical protein
MVPDGHAAFGKHYQDFALYSLAEDPAQMVNLVGRPEYKQVADMLRKELEARMATVDEPGVKINPVHYYA